MQDLTPQELYAELYDVYVPDWPGEIDFYRQLISSSALAGQGVLEIACGTGRVTLQLAGEVADMTGLDLSPELLDVARRKSAHHSHVQWVLGDMRSFELGRQFGCIISPGHSFQFMLTPEDQVRCLQHIKRHLVPGGLLVLHLDHQDFRWLGELLEQKEPVFKTGPVLEHPLTRQKYRRSYSWTYEPATQAATVTSHWEALDSEGNVVQVWKMEPLPLHCAFRFEIEHLLRRVGFSIQAVYGDFFRQPLQAASEGMIWLASNSAPSRRTVG